MWRWARTVRHISGKLATTEAANIQALVAGVPSPSPKASPGGPEFAENVALNLAARHEGGPYPRVTASTECRNQECFQGRNVINGRTENGGHGPRPVSR